MRRNLFLPFSVILSCVVLGLLVALPSSDEIRQRVLGPSVQVAVMRGIGGAISSWVSAGSGTVFKTKRGTYILTASHVVEEAKRVYETSEPTEEPSEPEGRNNNEKRKVTFEDVMVIVEREKDGLITGEIRVRCKVVKYSPPDEEGGEDISVLQPYEDDFLPYGARPLPSDKEIYPGQPVYHCGSLLGELVNSVTFGVISATARMFKNKPFIQLSSPAQPGSSGGGIFVVGEDEKCFYAGMLTRGTGETINLAVSIRRIRKTLEGWKMTFIFDEAL